MSNDTTEIPARRPPADLSNDDDSQRRWARRWRNIRAELESQGTWAEQDADTLDDYVRCMATAEELRQLIAEEGTTVMGSKEQTVKNPNVTLLREAMQDAKALRKDLLYTAAARAAREVGGGDGGEDDALDRILGAE